VVNNTSSKIAINCTTYFSLQVHWTAVVQNIMTEEAQQLTQCLQITKRILPAISSCNCTAFSDCNCVNTSIIKNLKDTKSENVGFCVFTLLIKIVFLDVRSYSLLIGTDTLQKLDATIFRDVFFDYPENGRGKFLQNASY
jgi:hypothetical protein